MRNKKGKQKSNNNRNSEVEDVDQVDFKQNHNPEEEEKEIANNQTMSTTLEHHDNYKKNNQAGKPPLDMRQSHDFPSRMLDVSPLKSKLTMLYESHSANGGDPA